VGGQAGGWGTGSCYGEPRPIAPRLPTASYWAVSHELLTGLHPDTIHPARFAELVLDSLSTLSARQRTLYSAEKTSPCRVHARGGWCDGFAGVPSQRKARKSSCFLKFVTVLRRCWHHHTLAATTTSPPFAPTARFSGWC
jgi:hypothetical protein